MKPSQLKLYRERIASDLFWDLYKTNTMCEHNVELLHVKLVVRILTMDLSWVKITK